jgi:hypothetical protein
MLMYNLSMTNEDPVNIGMPGFAIFRLGTGGDVVVWGNLLG